MSRIHYLSNEKGHARAQNGARGDERGLEELIRLYRCAICVNRGDVGMLVRILRDNQEWLYCPHCRTRFPILVSLAKIYEQQTQAAKAKIAALGTQSNRLSGESEEENYL